MSKSSHNRRDASRVGHPPVSTGVQPDLFQKLHEPAETPVAADLDVGPELLGAVHTALRMARTKGMSRERVVDRMNELLPELQRPITVRQLNAWTAASQEYKEFPTRYLPAFCMATECDLPLQVLAQAIGLDLVDARERAALRLGENHIEIARLKREQSRLQRTLGG